MHARPVNTGHVYGMPTRDTHVLVDEEASTDRPLTTNYVHSPVRDRAGRCSPVTPLTTNCVHSPVRDRAGRWSPVTPLATNYVHSPVRDSRYVVTSYTSHHKLRPLTRQSRYMLRSICSLELEWRKWGLTNVLWVGLTSHVKLRRFSRKFCATGYVRVYLHWAKERETPNFLWCLPLFFMNSTSNCVRTYLEAISLSRLFSLSVNEP